MMYVRDWNELNRKLKEVADRQVLNFGSRKENTPDPLPTTIKVT
jgi:hypothetical protein